MIDKIKKIEPKYLGDSIYASFDGFHIWLAVGHHEAIPIVALEPQTLSALIEYAKSIDRIFEVHHFFAEIS